MSMAKKFCQKFTTEDAQHTCSPVWPEIEESSILSRVSSRSLPCVCTYSFQKVWQSTIFLVRSTSVFTFAFLFPTSYLILFVLHNSPIYDECQTRSLNILILSWEWSSWQTFADYVWHSALIGSCVRDRHIGWWQLFECGVLQVLCTTVAGSPSWFGLASSASSSYS